MPGKRQAYCFIPAINFLLISHIYHHRGQLSVYLRLLDIPVPGMYCSSADEK
ncbi:MAG: DinB family protein [Ginsengibacter sp.]